MHDIGSDVVDQTSKRRNLQQHRWPWASSRRPVVPPSAGLDGTMVKPAAATSRDSNIPPGGDLNIDEIAQIPTDAVLADLGDMEHAHARHAFRIARTVLLMVTRPVRRPADTDRRIISPHVGDVVSRSPSAYVASRARPPMLIVQKRLPVVLGLIFVLGAAAATGAGVAVAREPVLVAGAVAAGAALWFLLPRLTMVTALLAGCFFYDDFFTETFGFWNPGKLVGVLAVGSFGYTWLVSRQPVVWARQLPVLGVMTASIAVSYTFARDGEIAQQVSVRYVMFFVLFFVTLQAIRERSDLEWIIDVTIVAATIAALIGLSNFFFNDMTRVSGPIRDPGDFGFVLGSTVPLAIYRAATSTGVARLLRVVAILVLVAAIIGTFARADILALTAAGAWVLATGRARIRWAVVVLAAVAMIGLAAYEARPDLIEKSLTQKQYVAQRNVDSRFALWGVAIEEWQTSPLVGVGPGNYQVRFPEFVSPYLLRIQTTHNAYLNILAELGLVGLTLFVLYLALSWDQLRQRARDDPREDWLRTAVAAGFLIAFVGALFMTQQFYPPFWFLAAAGAALTSSRGSRLATA